MLLMASGEMIFEYFFVNLMFRLPWQLIKSSDLDKIRMLGRDYSRNISVKLLPQNVQANFHFSHYKSMATISCYSNQSSYPIGTKNNSIRSPSLQMLYVKFGKNQLHGFRERCRLKMLTDGCLPILRGLFGKFVEFQILI